MLKKVYLTLPIIMSISFIQLAHADSDELTEKCRHGVLTEIYVAQSALYKKNGATQEYESSLIKAKKQGAILNYPDYAIDLMVNAEMKDVTDPSSVDNGLSGLSDDDLVIAPLIDDCLKKPTAYIRNY